MAQSPKQSAQASLGNGRSLTCARSYVENSVYSLDLVPEFQALSSQARLPDVMKQVHAILFDLIIRPA